MNEIEDKIIVQQVLNGNTMAFAELIERYQSRVYYLSYRMTGVAEDAEDITQNVFLKIYSGLANYNPEFKFFSWLYKTAINESINYLKVNKTRRPYEMVDISDDNTIENKIIDSERKKLIRENVSRLKPKYSSLIVLKYFEDLSYEEISSVTGLSIKKIKSRLFEARNLLRKSLTK